MEIHFCHVESDYIAAQTAWTLHRPWKIIRGYWYSLIVLGIVIFGVIVNPNGWRLELLVGVGVIVATTPSLLITWWRWHRQFKRLELANVDVTATVDGAGVTLSAQGNQRTLMWAGFSQIYESRRTLVLEKVEGDFLFLPKRAMTLAQLAEFNHLATRSTKNCKIKLSTRLA
jgi:hypothetical protein